jgi:GTPase SAR1 family protein
MLSIKKERSSGAGSSFASALKKVDNASAEICENAPRNASSLSILVPLQGRARAKQSPLSVERGVGAGDQPAFSAGTGLETKTASNKDSETSSAPTSPSSPEREASPAFAKIDHAENISYTPATYFEALRETHVRPLMDLNDRINALTMKETKINSTRIIVAGDQSHGKTSLLEALCGINLPRGEGIQTRVPLILQLRQGNKEHAVISIEETATKSGAKKERILLHQIEHKVREYTILAAGPGKGISDTPIQLSVFRNTNNQDNLTLVDLPGITRVALNDQAGGNGKLLEQQIMNMCRTYMSPKESILLNVVSSMVDFSTSASLQMSHELDVERTRTMLCITKVDQHSEQGLHDKIQMSIHAMRLNSQHVFAVRNRTQQENKAELPLDEVRRLEETALEKLSAGNVPEYQLGIKALSKFLVKTQCEEILKTLPRTQTAIEDVASALEEQLAGLGEPVGDIAACRAKAVQLIDVCTSRLQGEACGQMPPELNVSDSCEGEAIELSVTFLDFQDEYSEMIDEESSAQAGNFVFQLKEQDNDEELRMFLDVTKDPLNVSKASMDIVCTFTTTVDNSEVARDRMEYTYEFDSKKSPQGRGLKQMLSFDIPYSLHGKVTCTANLFVEKVEICNEGADDSGKLGSSLLCARLADLQDDFTSSIDKLYSKAHFFSEGFRMSLARELKGSRGGLGLPGIIAPHVPVAMLRKLRTKLAGPIRDYRHTVLEECISTTQAVIDKYVREDLHPLLRSLLAERARVIFKKQSVDLEHYHNKIIEWEENIRSSNHYFMDTVTAIKAEVYNDTGEERPSYLRCLSSQMIKEMSNEDQKLVDIQIEIFAYWKLMKKRLVDYVLLSTHTELINIPIEKTLKPTLLEAVFCNEDDQLVQLLSPDSGVVQTRASIVYRLEKLRAAMKDIEDYKTKHPGSWLNRSI